MGWYLILAAVAVGCLFLGGYGTPFTKAWVQKWQLKRAVANAKALVAKAEAEAQAIAKAKAVLAAASTPGATGPAG
jgi:hypothetical protein